MVVGEASKLILRLWDEYRGIIDARINELLTYLPEAELVHASKYICSGGKRLRGFLTMVIAKELGGDPWKALDAAVAVELVHASSLALDDIIDLDYERRGRPSAWIAIGVSKTVMVSNLLIPYAQQLLLRRYGGLALELSIRAWLDVSRGEVCDAFGENACSIDYIELIKLKTGSLFRLSAELGALASGRLETLRDVSLYGELLGTAYQIADDIVDYIQNGEKEFSLKLFSKWCNGSISKALEKLRKLVEQVEDYAASKLGSPLLASIPRFTVNKMLSQVNLLI